MRGIPVEVSADILSIKRQKVRNGLPLLMPILDSSQPSKDVIEVNIQTKMVIIELMTKYSQSKSLCFFVFFVICCCCRSTS